MASFDPITAALDIGGKLIDRLWPDPTKAGEAKMELAKMAQTGELAKLTAETELAKGQLQINTAEAQNPRLFVSGWRPWVGWVCGAAFAYAAIIEPVARFTAAVGFGYGGTFPEIDTSLTMQVLFGILGLGGLRSYEKHKRVAAK
jgi:hypothetical protein